jgi:UDP-glucose 4-epimerase
MISKAVVVGGSGFIGSHVADHLSDIGYQVTIYDRTKSEWLRNNQEIVIGDVQDSEKLNQTIAGAEVVYNFAALADLNQALEQPLKTVNINILGNLNVLEACHAHGVKRFIYASTVYVHSREGGFYRCSKQASEAYIEV